MKFTMAIALSCARMLCQYTQGNEVQVARPRWVIIATIIDQVTGERVKQQRLPGTELQFDDAASCKAVLDEVSPVHDERLVVELTCRKVVPTEGNL
jgi:hypothetical protein